MRGWKRIDTIIDNCDPFFANFKDLNTHWRKFDNLFIFSFFINLNGTQILHVASITCLALFGNYFVTYNVFKRARLFLVED